MLIRETPCYQAEVIVMSDIAIVAASAKATLTEIAKQSSALATGLQNAAPGDKAGIPNNSVLYLQSVAENLSKIADECDKLMTPPSPMNTL